MTWNRAKEYLSSLSASGITLIATLLILSLVVGCSECRSAADCGAGELCNGGKCRGSAGIANTDTGTAPNTDTDSGTGTETDSGTDTGTGTGSVETDTETDTDSVIDTDEIECEDATVDCPANDTICGHYECSPEKKCLLVEDEEYNSPCEGGEAECVQNVCRDGLCVAVPVNSGDPCADDGNACTLNICDNGKCGQIVAGQQCADDGDPCTNNVCDHEGDCIAHLKENGAPCDDERWCTGREVCLNGVCTNQDPPCATIDPCTTKVCSEPMAGQFLGECGSVEILPTGASCNNGFFCDGSEDICQSGFCNPSGNPCSGSTVCKDVRCEELAKDCIDAPLPDHSSCLDTSLCNGPEACLAGICESGIGPCEEQSNCSSRSCDESGGVAVCGTHIDKPDGTTCESEDSCAGDGARLCVGGECAYASIPACGDDDADSNFCTFMWPCSPSATPGIPTCKELPVEPIGFQADLVLGCTAGASDTDTDYVWDTTVTFTTVETTNEVSVYSGCVGDFTGGEAVVEIEVPSGTNYTVTSNYTASTGKGELQMLLITNPCDPDGTCLDMQEKSITATKDNGRHLIVVDGLSGGRGRGQLSIVCH